MVVLMETMVGFSIHVKLFWGIACIHYKAIKLLILLYFQVLHVLYIT